MKRKKKNNASTKFNWLFLAVGLIFIMAGIVIIIKDINFRKIAVEVDATIYDIKTTVTRDSDGDRRTEHKVYVSFEYNGKQYNQVYLPTYLANMTVGKQIKILCNPDNPYEIDVASGSYMGSIIMSIFGLIFALIGGINIFKDKRIKQRKNTLLSTGRRVMAVVDSIEKNMSYSVNKRHPYVIYCSYRDENTGIVYRYKSDNLWNDPSVVFAPGMYIPVYINGNDYSQYTVDAESLMNDRIVDYT